MSLPGKRIKQNRQYRQDLMGYSGIQAQKKPDPLKIGLFVRLVQMLMTAYESH